MTGEVGIRDKFSESDVSSFDPDMLVDAHSGSGELLQSVKLIGIRALAKSIEWSRFRQCARTVALETIEISRRVASGSPPAGCNAANGRE